MSTSNPPSPKTPTTPTPRPQSNNTTNTPSKHHSRGSWGGNTQKWGAKFWVTLVDPRTGVSFYGCPATGEVSWDPPVGNFVLPPSLDGEWWELSSPDPAHRGLSYYYHTKTKETRWERPGENEGFIIPLSVLQSTSLQRKPSISVTDVDEPPLRRSSSFDQPSTTSTTSPTRPQPRKAHSSTPPSLSHPHPHQHIQRHRTQLSTEGRPASGLFTIRGSEGENEGEDNGNGEIGNVIPSPNGREKDRIQRTSTPTGQRIRPHPHPHQYQHQPRSLDAAAELITRSSPPRLGAHSPAPGPHSPLRANGPTTPDPLRHSTSRKQKKTRPSIPPSPSPSSTSFLSQSTPLQHQSTPVRGQGQQGDIYLHANTRLSPGGGGSDTSSIRERGISAPVSVEDGVLHLNLNEGPILDLNDFGMYGNGGPRHLKGSTPVQSTLNVPKVNGERDRRSIPQPLAREITQFAQTDFARRYFATHRRGFIFRRNVPVERVMRWEKTPITTPLLQLPKPLHRDALRTFRGVQLVMGDRQLERPRNAPDGDKERERRMVLEEQRWMITQGILHGELRDEMYVQVVKQLNGCPGIENTFKGWQLLTVLLSSFPPSKNLESYLRTFIQQHTSPLTSSPSTPGRIDILAKYALNRLLVITRKGPRGKPPTLSEIQSSADAAFNPSIFGEPLDVIYRLQRGTPYEHLKVPIVLPFLADGILALNGLQCEGIFRVSGDSDAGAELKARIDRGCIVLMKEGDMWRIQDPLIPDEMYGDCVETAARLQNLPSPTTETDLALAIAQKESATLSLVARLPTMNRRVILFVVSFLQLFLEEKVMRATKMTAANLALVMAPNLLRCRSESMKVIFTNAQYEQIFVHNLLMHLRCDQVDPDYIPKHGTGA